MGEQVAKRQKSGDDLKSSALMQLLSSSDEEGAAKGTEETLEDKSESEDGEIDELTELDALRAKGNAEVDAMIEKGLASGGRDVMQKDARYFMMDNVVCEHCGVKGHLSFDCKEEQESVRCFLCGKAGHSSKDCPVEVCYYCKEAGHKMKDCPAKHGGGQGRKRRMRSVLPIRPPKIACYVCGDKDHLDCSLRRDTGAVLSCYNCGQQGHPGGGCNMTSVDRVIPIVLEMERERKQMKKSAGEKLKKDGKGNKEDGDTENEDKEKKGSGADAKLKKMTPKEYREAFLERARKSRYGKRER